MVRPKMKKKSYDEIKPKFIHDIHVKIIAIPAPSDDIDATEHVIIAYIVNYICMRPLVRGLAKVDFLKISDF